MMDGEAPRAATTLAARFAAWTSAVEFERLPESVVAAAKRCIVDTVGVSLAAHGHPLVSRVRDYARQTYARGRSTVLGTGECFAAPGAALVNGTAAHALDYDDTSYTGIMHGSAVVLPAALAASEEGAGDGRRLLVAFVAGAEVAYALALTAGTRHYLRGWWSSATFGVFGAAAAAARALCLSAERTTAALALAGARASGPKVVFGTDAKPLGVGNAAAAGVEGALLARAGVDGPSSIVEGRCGFLDLCNDGHGDAAEIDRLGRTWRLLDPGIFFKQYPVCSGAHAAVELTQRLLASRGLGGDDVRKVVCDVTPIVAISLVHDRPTTPQQAQFSMPFAVGSVLARGRLDVASLAPGALADAGLAAAMAKVEMRRVDALASDAAPEGARVRIETIRGETLEDYLGQPSGMPANPLSAARLEQKFLDCARAGGLREARAAQLLEHLLTLERATDASAPFRAAVS
jgi:2-methylcitrate dehydratase PrpD